MSEPINLDYEVQRIMDGLFSDPHMFDEPPAAEPAAPWAGKLREHGKSGVIHDEANSIIIFAGGDNRERVDYILRKLNGEAE